MVVTEPLEPARWKRSAFTDAQELAIYTRVNAGEKKGALARELGVHKNTIGAICKRQAAKAGTQ